MTATSTITGSRMPALLELGQSIWLDYLRRGMLTSGELAGQITDGLRGMTSNPTIFEQAIGGSTDYDDALARVAASSRSDADVFEALAVEDVRAAADLFRPVYDRTGGADGFVSLEVSPGVARDAEATIAEAERLWRAVDRPNVMIKIPGTQEGWPAIERCLTGGININITLLFSVEHYGKVAEAYLKALEARVSRGEPIDRIASVASFFVSRVDTEVDARLARIDKPEARELAGSIGIANARLAYSLFEEITASQRWHRLAAKGAKVQRPLWASTGTKNPAYSDVLYLDELIGRDTVNTVPPDTLRKFDDHGTVALTLTGHEDAARTRMEGLARLGIDFDDVTRVLEADGIDKFSKSYATLIGTITKKREALRKGAASISESLGGIADSVDQRLEQLKKEDVVRRIWEHDPSVWSDDPKTPEITDRLGWLTVGEAMAQQARDLSAFADEVRRSYDRVVLCGMGGSSLAPEVLWRTFGRRAGFPSLHVLDTTDPRAIAAVDASGDGARTLYLVSSKSGTTQETTSLFRHYWRTTGGRGEQFVAITDPGTPLEQLARERGFRRLFTNPPDIGGRYSALSFFGLVPAALIGIDVAELLHRAHRMAVACASCVAPAANPGARLGAVLAAGALAGRDKVTFILAPGLGSFGLWAEQLIAESTGKEGKGIIPIADEPVGHPSVYGTDRLFVAISLAGEAGGDEQRLEALTRAGHPLVRLRLEDGYDLGQEFFRWEFATAVAGSILGINAFDQPNVAESKANTNAVLGGKGSTASAPADAKVIDRFLQQIPKGHYLAIMAYLPPSDENDDRLAAIRVRLRDRLKVATTLGYGPRFLHSTGQLHKGGPATGHFLQITERTANDITIPGEAFTFGMLEAAQAEGDYQALVKRGRPVVRVEGLARLER